MSVYPIILTQSSFTHYESLYYPIEERGSQFGDGIYEVIRIYQGNYYLLKEHVERLYRSAEAIKITIPYAKEEMTELLLNLLKRNQMTKDGKVYLQITRGSAPRDHLFPSIDTPPNIYAYIKDQPRNLENMEHGIYTITERDIRWEDCYIKSLNLLPNVLAKQAAKEKNAQEAILHKDGIVTECSSSNVYMVKDGAIYTHPATNRILHGCVRMAIERFADTLDIPFHEEAFTLEDIPNADELFISSSSTEITPVVQVDGEKVGNGKTGTITRKLQRAYEEDAGISSN